MVGSVGDHEDAIGLADHAMALLYLASVPVGDTCTHHGHAQLGIVWMVQLPEEKMIILTSVYVVQPKNVLAQWKDNMMSTVQSDAGTGLTIAGFKSSSHLHGHKSVS